MIWIKILSGELFEGTLQQFAECFPADPTPDGVVFFCQTYHLAFEMEIR